MMGILNKGRVILALLNDHAADGAQGFENNHALHSRRSAST
jgi:hypothetical protein